jgi:trehalose/maltose hydrolase-like predicted phosphorylase
VGRSWLYTDDGRFHLHGVTGPDEYTTTGDSSLSASIQSIVAAEVGQEQTALDYFRPALWMDLADASGNT